MKPETPGNLASIPKYMFVVTVNGVEHSPESNSFSNNGSTEQN